MSLRITSVDRRTPAPLVKQKANGHELTGVRPWDVRSRTTSGRANVGTKGYGLYSATKAAVRSFTRTWANELGPKGIRVNVVSPGPTDTAMMASASQGVRYALSSMIPLGRMGRPDEVAAAVLFLASEESSFTTGAELAVDGGMAQV